MQDGKFDPYMYTAKLIDLYDGDTGRFLIDLGFKIFVQKKIRFFGINTPEKRGESKPEGLAAREYVMGLLEGKKIVIKTLKGQKTCKYGRSLCVIYTVEEDGTLFNVNEAIVKAGHGIVYLP